MSATQTEKDFFRTRLGADPQSMPDAYIDAIFDDIAQEYSGYDRRVIKQAAVVQGWDDLIARAVAEVDFTEGDASEKRSQIISNMEKARAKAEIRLASLVEKTKTVARWGGVRKHAVYKDKPTDG